MFDTWIHKDDILNLLSNLETRSNCIEKERFMFEFSRLKQHKKPKKQRNVNHSYNISKQIKNYRNSVKNGKTSYLEAYIHSKKSWKTQRLDKDYTYRYTDYCTDKYVDKQRFIDALSGFDNGNIIPINNLKSILKITQKTISEWEEKGIIKRHTIVINGGCKFQYSSKKLLLTDKKLYLRKFFNFHYYDLSEITDNLLK